MPQPITHYLVCEKSFKNILPGLWHEYQGYAGLGSYGPDFFYSKGMVTEEYFIRVRKSISQIRENVAASNYKYVELSDLLHWEGSKDFFCYMLDSIKLNFSNVSTRNKLKTFAYGYYSHVVTDCIFHPFIYRQSRDHWITHPAENYREHKVIETLIDLFLLDREKELNRNYQFNPQTECAAKENTNMLDKDLANLINIGLRNIYSDKMELLKSFDFCDTTANHHPLHATYNALLGYNLYEIGKIHLKSSVPEGQKTVREWSRAEFERVIPQGMNGFGYSPNQPLLYSYLDLYTFSVMVTEKIISESEQFFANSINSSSAFFKESRVPFLKENYCLDTGLLSEQNSLQENQAAYHLTRFGFGIEALTDIFESIATKLTTKV